MQRAEFRIKNETTAISTRTGRHDPRLDDFLVEIGSDRGAVVPVLDGVDEDDLASVIAMFPPDALLFSAELHLPGRPGFEQALFVSDLDHAGANQVAMGLGIEAFVLIARGEKSRLSYGVSLFGAGVRS